MIELRQIINNETKLKNNRLDFIRNITSILFLIGAIYFLYMLKDISIYINDFIKLVFNKISIYQINSKTLYISILFITLLFAVDNLDKLHNNLGLGNSIKYIVKRIIISVILISEMVIFQII